MPPTEAQPGGHHGAAVAGDGVLVGGNVAQLQDTLHPGTVNSLQIPSERASERERERVCVCVCVCVGECV